MKSRIFGEIDGYEAGAWFGNRKALSEAGIHPPTQAGISGSQTEGADSIVLSGGFEDDEDLGSEIIYTGHGGRDENTGKQIADQQLTRQNLALAITCLEGYPVRVTRGSNHESPYSPTTGYLYAGLYYVAEYWAETGLSGYTVWRFRLTSAESLGSVLEPKSPEEGKPPGRKASWVQRIVRDSKKSKRVKKWHKHRCQVCGLAIETNAGFYAEGAHIQPLGTPHDGDDLESNILCLCPNHHVMFDKGCFTIADDLSLIGIPGKLKVNHKHTIDLKYIKYHADHYHRMQQKE